MTNEEKLKEFAETYQEIENLIDTNWSMICNAYKFGWRYDLDYFSLYGEDIYIRAESRYYEDYGTAYIPLEWFTSEDTLQTKLNEIIKKNKGEELRKAKEEEEREKMRAIEEVKRLKEKYGI